VARPMSPQAVQSFCVAVLFVACSSLRAAPPAPVTQPAPAAVADEHEVGPALAEFLKPVDARDDKSAYALTTAAYRKAHSTEDFTKVMNQLRTELDLPQRQFQLSVARRPKDDRPREAIAFIVGYPAKTDRKSVSVVVAFADEGGRWRVADAELRRDGSMEGLRGAFYHANRGAYAMAMAGLGSVGLQARVTKLDEKSVTVEPISMDKQSPPRPPRSFEVDGQTQVFVIVPTEATVGGRKVPWERPTPGRLADLKVGDKVTVDMPPGQERALKITITFRQVQPGPGL
jgi:hypothetical protein